MKLTLLILASLTILTSCNEVPIKINDGTVDFGVDIKSEVIQSIAPLGMFNHSECTRLATNIYIQSVASLDKPSETIQFETSYFANLNDCENDQNHTGYVLNKFQILKISKLSSGTIKKYSIDLEVIEIHDMHTMNVEGLSYSAPLDTLDRHHTKFREVGEKEYLTFEHGNDAISFPFTYLTSGDNHGERRSYLKEVMVAIPETQPVPPGGAGGVGGGGAGM